MQRQIIGQHSKDDNPLNGVTTYDLVLISKHINGSGPLNSPYKMIAADANKGGSITTFDIAELRKLILGIYTVLPNNTSWRFVDKSFVFPNLNNPFQTAFPDKIGGVDKLAAHPTGDIRTIWLPADLGDPEQCAKQGNVLFYLTFKVLGTLPESGLPLWLDDAVLPNAAWRTEGTECSLVHQASVSKRTKQSAGPSTSFIVNCHPNPSSGDLTFSLDAIEAGKGRIALFSPYGVRLFAHDVVFAPGLQEINLPEAAQLPAGVYAWKVISGGIKAQGHWVKQ